MFCTNYDDGLYYTYILNGESITITANSIDNPETDVRRNERFHRSQKRLEALVTTNGLIRAT